MKTVQLNAKELEVYNDCKASAIKFGDNGYEFCIDDLYNKGITKQQLKGYLSQLKQKGLLEKFNDQYKDLLPEQKNILKEFIVSANSSIRLRNIVNEEMVKLSKNISTLKAKITDSVVRIKLEEIQKAIIPVKNTQKVDDNHLVSLMQYYELVNELRAL